MSDFRKTVIDLLIPYFQQDKRHILLVGDMGFGATDKIQAQCPNQIVNFGIMEQGAVGIAAGMSMSGMIPIVYTIVNFLAFRSIEQIRNDIMLQNLNVKLIGTGAENYFTMLGPSHTCNSDDIKIMQMVGMEVYDPFRDDRDFTDLVRDWISSPQAGYLRV